MAIPRRSFRIRGQDPVNFHLPTTQEIEAARTAYVTNEPRDLFYRVATELVDLAIQGRTLITVGEALAVLLQTWNKSYYRFHATEGDHLADIEAVIASFQQPLADLRPRSIETFGEADEESVKRIFVRFEHVLG